MDVKILLADRGWIFETMANELARRLPYVHIAESSPHLTGQLRYYINYSCFDGPLNPGNIAFFTHIEEADEARSKFFLTAKLVDAAVCHSKPSEQALRAAGIKNVLTISPGVDLEQFVPKVRIGVVGRTYPTGRKGEHIISDVLDTPGIEWSFTGDGWPLPGERVMQADLPSYYRSLDYLLVPSLYEAGPMSVVEALACGTEVIAPPVGWVSEFPHIEFRTGDAQDLRRVLLEVLEKKEKLRRSVAERSWENWTKLHDQLFREVWGRINRSTSPMPSNMAKPLVFPSVEIRLHGTEGQSPGGPSVRVPLLASALRSKKSRP